MILDPFYVLDDVLQKLGAAWLCFAVLLLAYGLFGPLVRSTLLVICVLICTQLWFGPLYTLSRDLRFLLLLILCVRGLMYVRRTPGPPGEGRVARNLAIALAALSVVSVSWAESEWYSFGYAASFCLGIAVTFGLLWRLADGARVMDGFAKGAVVLAAVLFGMGFLVAGVAYWLNDRIYFEATHLELLDFGGRYSGVFYNPNAAGMIGTMFLPMLVAAPRSSLGRTSWLRGPAIVVTAATIFLSGSRSALIGGAIALLLIAMYRFGAGAIVTLAFGCAVVGTLAVYSPVDDIDATAVGHITRTKHLSTLSGRVDLWQEGWDEAQGHLAFGRGWGHSRLIGGDADTEGATDAAGVRHAMNLHNAHLQLLIDVGLLGVSLFWLFCVGVIHAGWCILRAPRTPENTVGVVIFTSVLALLADTWVHGSIWSMGSPTTLAFWGMCALTLKQGARARQGSAEAAAAANAPAWTAPPIPALTQA